MAVPAPTPLRTVDNNAPDGASARQSAIQTAQNQNQQRPFPKQEDQRRPSRPSGNQQQQPFAQQYIISGPPGPQFSSVPTEAFGNQHGSLNPYLPTQQSNAQQGMNPYMTEMAPAANASYRSNGFGNGGGFTAPMLMSEYTAGQIATLQSRLSKKLGPEYITKRPGPGGGPKLSYVEGWKVINLANEVFGFNGWSSQIMSLNTDFIDEPTQGRYNVGISAIIRIILRDGTFHEDTGYGQCDNTKGKGAALDKAKKEAVTDAVKRTLRSFGNVLGNCLYDKEYTKEIEKVKWQPVPLERRDLWRRPEFDEPESQDPNAPPPPPSCRAHPHLEALNGHHLAKQTSGPSIAQSRMKPRPYDTNSARQEFAVPALPSHLHRMEGAAVNSRAGANANSLGQSIVRPMTTALEEEFSMDEAHLATMDLDDPATMPTGADYAIHDTSYEGSVFDQSMDSISVASTSVPNVSTRLPHVNTRDFADSTTANWVKGPTTESKVEQKTSSDEDEKEAGRRRRRAALLQSAQQQPAGLQTEGFGQKESRESKGGIAAQQKQQPIVGGFRFPSDSVNTGVGSGGSGGRSISDSAAVHSTRVETDFASARGWDRSYDGGNEENG
ncbi:hypothetical protein QFC22_002688 [Naganishia vaughanmartiniae]|uniref:Uncharacterized protein n=1 Tax=Naganishia vaughanmartiniae TaxID=1424756 RepID=A0ACC2XA10_9TREE|nr:hypothetical protein QFC22_002688 [Naganishia vaughanmartiniae]